MREKHRTLLFQFFGAATAAGIMILFCSPDILAPSGDPLTPAPVIFIGIGIGALIGGQIASAGRF